jgi:integrase
MKQERFACGYNSDLFISDICGNYLNYYSYNKYLGEVSERVLEKPIKITSHVMRHTHVALMAEQGVSLEVISRRLGHSNSKITREIYHHVTKKMQEKDNQQIKDIKIL